MMCYSFLFTAKRWSSGSIVYIWIYYIYDYYISKNKISSSLEVRDISYFSLIGIHFIWQELFSLRVY